MRLLLSLILAISCSAFGQTYTIQTLAGAGLAQNTPALSASLGGPEGVVVDNAGNIFVALYYSCVVLRLDAATGALTPVAGNGTCGYSGDNGPATNAQLNGPSGITLDGSANLYIADFTNSRVRMVSAGIITTVAGNGTFAYSGDNGPASSAALNFPVGVAVDASGNLYIADWLNCRVRRVSKGTITTFAGNGTCAYAGDNGPAANAALDHPSAVAAQSNSLYIADTSNNRVRLVSGGVITTVAGSGVQGYGGDNGPAMNAQIDAPDGLALDGSGNLYISDQSNNRIREVSNGTITTVAGNGTRGYSGDGGNAASAALNGPDGVAVDGLGNLYITDNNRVREVSAGLINTVAGGGDGGDGGLATNAQLNDPPGVAAGPSGALYISELASDRVRLVSGGTIQSVAGNGIPGYGGDGGPAAGAQLAGPQGVAVDAEGNVYVADSGNFRIRKISGEVITTVAGSGRSGNGGDNGPATSAQFGNLWGIAVDSADNLFIADSFYNSIRRVSGGIITTVAGTGTSGSAGDGGPATSAQLRSPQGVATDSSGNLYIADTGNNRVRMVSGGVITTVAGSGMQGYGGDNGPATSAELWAPSGIGLDSFNNLYILDLGNSRIRKISGGVITTIAGNGTPGFNGDNGPALSAELNPSAANGNSSVGLAVDSSGNVYFADSANNRVRILIPSGPSCTYAVTPSALTAPASGGNLPANVQTASGCAWAVQGLPDWITFSGNAVSSGAGTVSLAVAPNTGAARSAQISVAGLSVTINQASGVLLVNTGGVVNGASYTAPVVPGSIAAIFGNFLLPAPVEVSAFPIPTNLGGLSFQFSDGTLAPLFYANVGQVNAQIPWELEGQSQTTITASINGQTSASQTVSLATYAPGIFAVNSEGTGQGAILDANYHLVDASNPAIPGQTTVLIYCTGLGPVSSNQPATGAPASLTNLAHTSSPVTATISGVSANVTFSGLAPGYVGLYQVNAQVPAGLAANSSALVMISIEGANSNTVTIAVQ